MKVSLKIVFALVCAAALCCAQTETASSPGVPSGTPPAAKEAPAPATPVLAAQAPAAQPAANPAGTKAPYVLGPLDLLSVKVWNNPNLSSPLDVGPDGMISMPLIGQVKADGLTAQQLKEALTARLSEFLNSPEVDVQVL